MSGIGKRKSAASGGIRRARARCRAPRGSAQSAQGGVPHAEVPAPSAIGTAAHNALDMRNNSPLETLKP